MGEYGYSGKTLMVDVTSGKISDIPSDEYTDGFIGGRGVAAKIYWDMVQPETAAFDSENILVFTTGPLAGLPIIAGSRWQVCGKSPVTNPEHFSYANLGGTWGTALKFAGYDSLVLRGKSEKPVFLYIHDDIVEIRDASYMWGKGAIETRQIIKDEVDSSARIVAIGPAGENMVVLASLLADNDSSGGGGLGSVLGSKNVKAIAVKSGERKVTIADPDRFRELSRKFRDFERLPFHLVEADHNVLGPLEITLPKLKQQICYGCTGCMRVTYEADSGETGKFMCQSAWFYQHLSQEYYGQWNDVPFHANKLCNEYGLDTMALQMMILWLIQCHEGGILNGKNTGIPMEEIGSMNFIQTFVEMVSLRRGFGDVLARGTIEAAKTLGDAAESNAANLLSKAGWGDLYGPRLYNTTALMYAMEPRTSIHQLHEIVGTMYKWEAWARNIEGAIASSEVLRSIAKRFWGSEIAADFSTYEGKALAAKMIQDREYAKECLILCDWQWPIMDSLHSPDHVGDPTMESKILSAVLGKEVDEQSYYKIGEKAFNLQRAVLCREGHSGRLGDVLPESRHSQPITGESWLDQANAGCLVPGKNGEIISKKGSVVDKTSFEAMKDEYYQLREWDVATGFQTKAKLHQLGLAELVSDLEQRGLLAETT